MNTTQFPTKDRILDAAEILFAQHGFAGASLRQVTFTANVNLAAVNYHFGSKENLINAVLRRRLEELNTEQLASLKKVRADTNFCLEDILAAFIKPALALCLDNKGGNAFVCALARAYAEHNESLRKFLSNHYGQVLKEFATAFNVLLPTLDPHELYWRLDIVSGALAYAMADFGGIARRGMLSEQMHSDVVAKHLIKFAAAGLRQY